MSKRKAASSSSSQWGFGDAPPACVASSGDPPAKPRMRQVVEVPHAGRLFVDYVAEGEAVLTDIVSQEQARLTKGVSDWELFFDDEGMAA
eukprot:1811624-Alexandrium_andersonii.AAC.1